MIPLQPDPNARATSDNHLMSSTGSVQRFYDEMATWYHLIFEDWDRSIARQAAILSPFLSHYTGKALPSVLDCACGIGTQALGLAQRGHPVTGSDLSPAAIRRAEQEAAARSLPIPFSVADLRCLPDRHTRFDVVLAADNALPHLLTPADLHQAIHGMAAQVAPGGLFVATLRDYDHLLQERPSSQPAAFFDNSHGRRIVHQVWDWAGDQYDLHLYLTLHSGEPPSGWTVHHLQARYRALQRAELSAALTTAGLSEVQWLQPAETGFYQPLVIARR